MADKALVYYLTQLQSNPIRTKSLTTATLNGLSEFLASYFANAKDPKTGSYLTSRVPKMAIYGFFISAPLSHYLVNALQKAFRGKKGLGYKILQIIVSNLLVQPIQSTVFVTSMAIIAGARTKEQIIKAVKISLPVVLRAGWISSPFVLAIAQALIPEYAWVPFFSLCAFLVGIYNNTQVKKKQQAARLAAEKDSKLKPDESKKE